MEDLELVSFQIISSVGAARSMYIEAIGEAKKGHFEEADRLIEEGAQIFLEGHKAHSSLIQKEASGEHVNVTLLLMHAEDQLMTTDSFKIVAQEFVDVYRHQMKNQTV